MTLLAETAASGRPSFIVYAPTLPALLARLAAIASHPPEVDPRDGRPVARCSLTRKARVVVEPERVEPGDADFGHGRKEVQP